MVSIREQAGNVSVDPVSHNNFMSETIEKLSLNYTPE